MLGLKQKKKVNKYTEKSPFEAISEELLGLGKGVATSGKDFVEEGRQDVLVQLLNVEKKVRKLSGDLANGQELDLGSLNQAQEENKPKSEAAPGLDYGHEYTRDVLQYTERSTRVESQEIKQRVEEIMVELKRLVTTSAVLEAEFKQITTDQVPVKAGKYHLNFFEWMLSVIRSAREKIEDSSSWLAALSSKKSKRQYWAMFKKHGTTFGLSNERVVATQTG